MTQEGPSWRPAETVARVTVVIPTHDRTTFLEEAVRSVVNQKRPVSEILVVDDGSGEVAREHVDAVARLDPRIAVHRLPVRRGVAAARNTGLELATGDFLLFLDDDDLLHPDFMAASLDRFAREPGLDVATCLYEMFFTPSDGGTLPAAVLFNYKLLDRHPLRWVDTTNFGACPVMS